MLIAVASFFLIWTFVLSTFTYACTRLGTMRSIELTKQFPKRFYYYPLHSLLFKRKNFELVVFSSTIGENFARLAMSASIVFGLFALSPIAWHYLVALVAISLIVIFLIGDFFPRLWTAAAPQKALGAMLPYASFFLYLTLPISFIFLKLAHLWSRSLERQEKNDPIEDIKETVVHILQSANIKGKLNASDKKLIESVIKFKDRIVREVMVPRVDLFSLSSDTPIREAVQALVEQGYSRTPVFQETIDNITGVLMFKDILELYMDCAEGKKETSLLDAPIETITKRVFYTPETKKVSHLLQEFRAKQMHMAIVVDEYGGTEGVVTMEDILEEIVGEIADEYDVDEELLFTTQPGGKAWIVDARMSILDAEEAFNIHIPQEGEYDTIGGYIFHKVGSIPQKGFRIHHEEFDLEILGSTERSIEKVRITSRETKA